MAFVELAARTNFSLLRGGSPPKALTERAAHLGYRVLGVADCDGIYGMVRALEAAEESCVRLVVGCELAIDAGEGENESEDVGVDVGVGVRADAPSPERLWLHVESIEGYRNLCAILTVSHARHPKGQARKPEEGVARNQFAGIALRQ
ncbi:MAG TPA: PHP domain-containing protein, partial [Polyangiaceae bacterium]|nr:PHP domain-containing protein [Polyangiaceae bacterium]